MNVGVPVRHGPVALARVAQQDGLPRKIHHIHLAETGLPAQAQHSRHEHGGSGVALGCIAVAVGHQAGGGQEGISVSTVRKALAELEERGYVKKMNAKGTIVTEPDDSRVSQLLPNPRRTKEALRYLNSLQLLTLIIHPAALLAAERFTEKEIKELTEKFSRTDSIYLIDMFEAVLKHIELEPMRVILTEAFRLTEWGYYITYYTKKRRNIL